MYEQTSVTCVVDCENLFRSAKNLYGKVTIDYKKLLAFMASFFPKEYDTLTKLCFVSIHPQQLSQMDFLAYLGSIGFTVEIMRAEVADDRGSDEKNERKQFNYYEVVTAKTLKVLSPRQKNAVFVACGSRNLKPLYENLHARNIPVRVFGFHGSVSHYLHVRDISYLGQDLLIF